MNTLIYTHLGYLALAVPLTIWVARTLHRHGRFFLVDSFHGNEGLADSVNHLLVVGFYLLNVGFVCLYLKGGDRPTEASGVIETVVTKVGLVMLVLGAFHFFNLYLFNRLRKRALEPAAGPPVLPIARLAIPPVPMDRPNPA